MSLRTKLTLATIGVVLVLFGLSEWTTVQQVSGFIDRQEEILAGGNDSALALERLREAKAGLFRNLRLLSVLHAVLTVLLAAGLLNLLWYRLVLKPIRALLSHINILGRGTWTGRIPVDRNDEIGQLAQAFNRLGEELTITVHQFGATSKLSALALIGNRIVRRVRLSKDHAEAVSGLLEVSKQYGQPVPDAAVRNLRFVSKTLGEIEADFTADLERVFDQLTLRFRPREPAAVPRQHAASANR